MQEIARNRHRERLIAQLTAERARAMLRTSATGAMPPVPAQLVHQRHAQLNQPSLGAFGIQA
eukprot:6420540-Alexandrium_andersonii.AAC.1